MYPEWSEKMREIMGEEFLTTRDLDAIANPTLTQEDLTRILHDPLVQKMMMTQEGLADAVSQEFLFQNLVLSVLSERRGMTKMFLEQTDEDVRDILRDPDLQRHIAPILYARSMEISSPKGYKDLTKTSLHNIGTALMIVPLGKKLGLPDEKIRRMVVGMINHDDGKYLLPREIVNKPGKLDDYEWAIMRTHPEIGNAIVLKTWPGIPEESTNVILYHHERLDGRGYPFGLRRDEIPYEAQVAGVVDGLDALTEYRPYKRENGKHYFTLTEALDVLLIRAERGELNPDVVKCLVQLNRESRIHPDKGGLYVKSSGSMLNPKRIEPVRGTEPKYKH